MKNNDTAAKKPRNFKKFKYGTMSLVVIALVIAIVVVLNIIVGMLMKRYPIKVDLTADGRYELCDETINALKELETDVEIAVMYPEETLLSYTYYQMIPKILENYQVYAEAGNGNIEVKYVDTTKDPDVVSKYSKYYNGTISDGSIVVYANEKVRVTHISSMFTTNSQSSYYQTEESTLNFIGESEITSAILSVTDANPVNVAVASMMNSTPVFGEDYSVLYCVQSFMELLSSNGYECTEIDIMTDELSTEDYDLVLIPAPAYDFNEDIIAKLEDFLYNDANYGKNLVYVTSPYEAELTNISEFLSKWDIAVEDAYVFDDVNTITATINSLGATVASPIVSIADTEAVGTLPNDKLPTIAPLARPVSILAKNTEYVTSEVLKTSAQSYLRNLDGSESDVEGAKSIMALSKRERAEGFDVYTSNVLAIGSVFMTDPSIMLNTSAYNNANVILNTLNTLTGKDSSIVIPQKNLQQETLAITASQAKGIMIIVIFIIPLIVVAAGIAVYVRRRNR